MRYESDLKPVNCPACGSPRVAKILYGKRKESTDLRRRVKSGEVVFGGCHIEDDNPYWQCVECLINIYPKRGNVSAMFQ